ncbi:MAG: hypothetical protein GX670_08860 [Bacteroidales bacterium]|nr:hypothetical protein [Bacteroidales bacterium]
MGNDRIVNVAVRENIFWVYILFSIVLFFPNSTQGALIYLPQIIVGMVALYAIIKSPILKPTWCFLCFALCMLALNLLVSMFQNSGGIVGIFKSSLRLYYPFIGLVIGGLLKKKISPKSFLSLLIFFLLTQFIIGFLQVNSESFRILTFSLYRPSKLDYYIMAFSWKTGRRIIGSVGNPNSLGMLMVIMNSSIILLSDFSKNKLLTNSICFGATLYTCLHTQSRTAILLFIATTLLLYYWNLNTKGLAKILCIYVFSLLVIISFLYLKDLANREISISALYSRYNIWVSHITQLLNNEGYINFPTILVGVGFAKAREFGAFDNIYVKYFVSGGVTGLSVFLITGLQAIRFLRHNVHGYIWKRMGLAVIFLWLLGSIVAEYQEMFKLSIITFILLGYAMYPTRTFELKIRGA